MLLAKGAAEMAVWHYSHLACHLPRKDRIQRYATMHSSHCAYALLDMIVSGIVSECSPLVTLATYED